MNIWGKGLNSGIQSQIVVNDSVADRDTDPVPAHRGRGVLNEEIMYCFPDQAFCRNGHDSKKR